MSNLLRCKKCGEAIEISQLMREQIESEIKLKLESDYRNSISELEKDNKSLQDNMKVEIERVKEETTRNLRSSIVEQVRQQYLTLIDQTKVESEESQKENRKLLAQIAEQMKMIRELRDSENYMKIDFEKKLFEEKDRIRLSARKEAEDEMQNKLSMKEKQLADLEIQLRDAQRKVSSGSQQLQGEIKELELEAGLRSTFIYDKFAEVPKGINGADILQTVCNNNGSVCGLIVWESKNTKSWSDQWVQKLKDDTRKVKGHLSIIVTNTLPEEIKTFGLYQGIWVTSVEYAIPLAVALREQIIQLHMANIQMQGRSSKAEIVYEYMISKDFRQRLEVLVEYFRSRRDEIDKERSYFTKKWEKEDRSILKALANTAGIYGDIQGMTDNSLPEIGYFELE